MNEHPRVAVVAPPAAAPRHQERCVLRDLGAEGGRGVTGEEADPPRIMLPATYTRLCVICPVGRLIEGSTPQAERTVHMVWRAGDMGIDVRAPGKPCNVASRYPRWASLSQ